MKKIDEKKLSSLLIKNLAPLQENQTITYIEDDGNEETGIVRKITRNTDDDTTGLIEKW